MRLSTVLVPLVALIACAAWPVTWADPLGPHVQTGNPPQTDVRTVYPRYQKSDGLVDRIETRRGPQAQYWYESNDPSSAEFTAYFNLFNERRRGFEHDVLKNYHSAEQDILARLKKLYEESGQQWYEPGRIELEENLYMQLRKISDMNEQSLIPRMDQLESYLKKSFKLDEGGRSTTWSQLWSLRDLRLEHIEALEAAATYWDRFSRTRYGSVSNPNPMYDSIHAAKTEANALEGWMSKETANEALRDLVKRFGSARGPTSRAAEEGEDAHGQTSEAAEQAREGVKGFHSLWSSFRPRR